MSEKNMNNRRQFVRLPKGYSIEINEFKFPITGQDRVSATCSDISTGGVCVESPEAFLKAMSNNTKSFHEWVESMDTHTFTMYEAENDLENTLLEAYYEKLKALMQKAAEDVVDSQYKTMANAILDKLSCLKIRRIF